MHDGTLVATWRRIAGRGVQSLLLALAVLLVNPAACDDAPGCAGGCGGCTGKKAIRDFSYEGPSCLAVTPNDCTVVQMEFRNDCSGPATIGGVEIPAGTRQSLEPVRATGGGYTLCPEFRDCPGTTRTSDETVVLDGTVDAQAVQIRLFVTAEQC